MRSTSIRGVKSLDPQDWVHIFWRLKSLATTNFFGLGHAGPQIFQKIKAAFSIDLKSVNHSQLPNKPKRACMGGAPAAHGRYLHDGEWSCIPERAVSSVNFVEQQYSAPTHPVSYGYASHAASRREFKFGHSFAFVQVPYQHFTSLNNSSCPCLHAAYRIRRTGRARAAGGRAGLSALVPLPVFLSLLV